MKVFVIMPFDEELDLVYRDLIKKPLEEKNHIINRADDIITHQNILKGIIQNISEADLIIADLTAQNANVYYELGIAHTLARPTIQIVQDIEDVPFDLRPYQVNTYSVHFSSAENLTKHLLDIIEREEGKQFKFANPVVETIGADSNKEITIPTYDHSINNHNALDDSEKIIEENSEPGLLDSIVLAEESMTEIGFTIAELIEPMNRLSERTQEHQEKFDRLNFNPQMKGLNSKRLQIARQFASDLNEFSDAVAKRIPRLNESWSALDQGIGYVLSVGIIHDKREIETVRTNVIIPTRKLQNSLRKGLQTLESFRDVCKNFPKLSKATNRAIGNSDRTLQKLCDEYRLGDSVLIRIIDLATDMIDRYNVESSSLTS